MYIRTGMYTNYKKKDYGFQCHLSSVCLMHG